MHAVGVGRDLAAVGQAGEESIVELTSISGRYISPLASHGHPVKRFLCACV